MAGSLCLAASDVISSRWTAANALAVTIRPPFEERANAATARSISAASRTLIGLTSTPSDGATDWITANWPIPAGYGGIPKNRHSRHARRDLLEQFKPFSTQTVFKLNKAGNVSTRPRHALDETRADGIGTFTNTIGTVWVAEQRAGCRSARCQNDVRCKRDQFRCVFANFARRCLRPSDSQFVCSGRRSNLIAAALA